MALGAHRVALQTKTGLRVERSVIVATPRLAAGSAYKAVEAPGGWAITWALPGGGAETCQVFDDAVARVRL